MLKRDAKKKALEYLHEADRNLKEGNSITGTAYSLQAIAYMMAMDRDLQLYGEYIARRREGKDEA